MPTPAGRRRLTGRRNRRAAVQIRCHLVALEEDGERTKTGVAVALYGGAGDDAQLLAVRVLDQAQAREFALVLLSFTELARACDRDR